MIEGALAKIGVAGAKFGVEAAKGAALDGRKRAAFERACSQAYAAAASATIEASPFSRGTEVWNELTALLGDEDRAQVVAQLLRQGQLGPAEYARQLRVARLETEDLLWDFMGRLNARLAAVLAPDQRALVEIILTTLAALERKHAARLHLTTFEQRRASAAEQPHHMGMLSAYARSIPLIGRVEELASLHAWLDAPHKISVRVMTGDGGRGKTRLALAFCAEATKRGWHAGFVPDDELRDFPQRQPLRGWDWAQPTLIVIDYAAQRADVVHQWLVALADHPARMTKVLPSLRVLLLDRRAEAGSGWLAAAFGRAGGDADDVLSLLDSPDPIEVLPVPTDQLRTEIARAVLTSAQAAIDAATLDTAAARALIVATEWGFPGDPLTIMMAALAVAEAGNEEIIADRTAFAVKLANRELDHIGEIARNRSVEPDLVLHLAACAALAHGLDRVEAERMAGEEVAALNAVNAFGALAALRHALPGDQPGSISPVLPDLIGEALLLEAWKDGDSGAIVRSAARLSAMRVAATMVRTAQDYAEHGRHECLAWIDALVEGGNLMHVLRVLDDVAQDTLALREKAAEVTNLAVQAAREHSERERSEDAQAALAVTLNNLGNRLSALGRREEALDAATKAVAIDRDLATARPDAFRAGLAGSLNNLANRLSGLGRREEALDAATEAVAIRRDLAAARPDAFRPDLAGSLNNRANRFSDLGRREEALDAATEAVAIYRDLAAARPDAFRPGLAMSLTNLATFLSDLGRREEALDAATEAVAIYRDLATARPDAFRPDLAMSLNNLANRLSDLGRHEEALDAATEAVAIRRDLAAARPDAFRPDLAGSLSNLATFLSDLGRREEPIDAATEAVAIYRDLAAARPDAFRPDLAMSLNNLANRFSDLGRREEALDAATEAVAIRRDLAAARPDAFRPGLALSLNNLANRFSDLGRREEALDAATEAVAIYRELVAARPDAFRPGLATSLNNLATFLSDLGRREEALNAATEAVAIYRDLAAARPDAFRPDLAMSLSNLAGSFSDLGRREEALAAVSEAVALYRELAAARPDAFHTDLAMSLNNFAIVLGNLGRAEESLDAAAEAVAIRRELLRTYPDAFRADLATSLRVLAQALRALGRADEADAAAQEAAALIDEETTPPANG